MTDDVDRLSTFPSELSSVGPARRFVRTTLTSYLPARALETVELLTSEVVTNAVLHASSSPIVEVTAEGGTARVSVQDQDPGWPTPRRVPDDATSGRGLSLVDSLADGWGVERVPNAGKRIWFEVRSATVDT